MGNDGVVAGGASTPDTKAKDQCKLLHMHTGSLCFITQALCKRVCEGDEWKCVFKHVPIMEAH